MLIARRVVCQMGLISATLVDHVELFVGGRAANGKPLEGYLAVRDVARTFL
jgi:hypothetical protein